MTGTPTARLGRTIRWLLTPIVVWAATFVGAWLGATLGANMVWLVGGGLLGAGGSMVGWVYMMRRPTRKESGTNEKGPPA
ncbi:MAG: hypothetical protein ACE5HT_03215 [Gemmatimonadales bacterium]